MVQATRTKPHSSTLAEREPRRRTLECTICLESPVRPVVTLCGHLFCWDCLVTWVTVHAKSKRCPVCKSAVQKAVRILGQEGDCCIDFAAEDEEEEAPYEKVSAEEESLAQSSMLNERSENASQVTEGARNINELDPTRDVRNVLCSNMNEHEDGNDSSGYASENSSTRRSLQEGASSDRASAAPSPENACGVPPSRMVLLRTIATTGGAQSAGQAHGHEQGMLSPMPRSAPAMVHLLSSPLLSPPHTHNSRRNSGDFSNQNPRRGGIPQRQAEPSANAHPSEWRPVSSPSHHDHKWQLLSSFLHHFAVQV